MDYQEALRFLNSLVNYERKPPLDFTRREVTLNRVQELADLLGNPHRVLRIIHIAGTKGKGSTAAMTESVLLAHGLRTGLYTSPHLVDVRERIRIDGAFIDRALFGLLMGMVAPHIEKRRKDDERRATYFETLTHLAFLAFERERVDAAVVEVGMGGRLDATNVARPVVCGITAIGIDHTAQLGNNLRSIAREKAGILKPGVPVVAAPMGAEAADVIAGIAAERGCRLLLLGRDFRLSERGPRFDVDLDFAGRRLVDLEVPLLGRHQRVNAAAALALAEVFLEHSGGRLDDEKAQRGLAAVFWPGRVQKVKDEPAIYLDGAHNRQSLEALFATLREAHPGRPLVVAFGCAMDKDIPGMLEVLRREAAEVVFTKSISPRACEPQDLARSYGRRAGVSPDVPSALGLLEKTVQQRDAVGVMTGSLYIVGEALSSLGISSDPRSSG